MARVPYLSKADLDPQDHELLARDLNLYYAMANSPDAARAFAVPALYVRHDSPLDPRLRELAIIQIGYSSAIAYEYAHHIELGIAAGLTETEIHAIARESAGIATDLSELERAVLQAARELVAGPALRDETYAVLSGALNNRDLIDLIMVMSLYCGVVRLLGALQIDLEAAYEHYLETFPLAD